MPESAIPTYITSLIRHFEDLRDGTHGGSASRKGKEGHFEKAVQLLAPVARQVLTEMNKSLLLDTGHLTETGLQRSTDGGLSASWALSWPEQQAAGIQPIVLQAYFGGGFHHPHLRGTMVRDWPARFGFSCLIFAASSLCLKIGGDAEFLPNSCFL